MKKSGTILSSIALASAAVLALSGCGGSSAPAGEGGDDADALTPVTLMLNWYPYGEHAAFYYGVDQGIFEEHGIDLTIKAGQGSTKTAQAVGQGQVDFGWADTPPSSRTSTRASGSRASASSSRRRRRPCRSSLTPASPARRT